MGFLISHFGLELDTKVIVEVHPHFDIFILRTVRELEDVINTVLELVVSSQLLQIELISYPQCYLCDYTEETYIDTSSFKVFISFTQLNNLCIGNGNSSSCM